MWRNIFKKDIRMLVSGRFFLMSLGFLVLYTLYVNLGYVKFMNARLYNVYLYDPDKTQTTVSASVQRVSSKETLDAILLDDTNGIGIDAGTGTPQLIFYETTENADRNLAE